VEIKLKCSCGQVLKVGTESAGKVGKCPACQGAIRIPTLEEIEEARKSLPQPVEVPEGEEEIEEEAEEAAEEEAGGEAVEEEVKPATRRFKAPVRSKTRSKMVGDVGEDKEDRKKTKTRHGEEGGKKRGKKRGKTRGGRKGRTSVIDKYKRKGGGEDDEGDYAPQKKSPLKILIVIGVVAIGGLIAAYAVHWGPLGKARARTEEYVELMNTFVKDIREKIIERYEGKVPGNLDDYNNWLQGIKDTAADIDRVMTPAMKNAYEADDLMHKILKILSEDAVAIVKDRNEVRAAHEFDEEKNKDYIKRFDDKLHEVNVIAETIKQYVSSVETNMRR
jgi:hypothetical protein